MAMFKAFKPSGMEKIARSMGYQGGMDKFQNFLAINPAQQQQMDMYTNKAMQMAKGGMVKKFAEGGLGDGPKRTAKYYTLKLQPSQGAEDEATQIRIGSKQDTSAMRKRAATLDEETVRGFYYTKPYDVRVAEQEAAPQPVAQQPVAPQPVTDTINSFFTNAQLQPQEPASLAEAARRQDAGINQPIYQAPYLSGTRFTPTGQYVQDPNTLQMIPQAYTPLNQGYGAAAANFQNTMPVSNVQYLPISTSGDMIGGFPGSNRPTYGTQTPKFASGGAVPPRRTEIKGQDHMLAYITPQEGELLKAHGGSGRPGPMGIPSFEGDGAMHADFYQVPVGQGADATSRRIYIGSSQDTVANRQISGGTVPDRMTGGRPVPMARDVPYEVAAAANPNFAATQEYYAAQQAAAQAEADTTPQGPTDLTGQYGDQLADSMANNVQTFGTTFRPENTPPLLNTAFVDNTGQTYINTSGVQRAVAGQPITPTYSTQVQGYATGGSVTNPTGTQAGTPTVTQPSVSEDDGQPSIGQFTVEQMYQPGVAVGGTTIAAETPYDESQDIAADTGTLTGKIDTATELAETAQADMPEKRDANLITAETVTAGVSNALDATSASQSDPSDPRLQIQAAQQTQSSVGNLQAAQGTSFLINNPVQRQLQNGELISGTGVDAAKAAALTAQTQAAAAQANPSAQAMVQDQLSGLMTQFQGANPPAWAAGAMRAATSAMAARGLGSSSLAGQAIVQAAMESALPIAMADAQTVAKFESQNLSNRQQSAMLAAEQRAKFMGQEFDQIFQTKVMNASKISDIANQNFTAEQQVQLENSRAVNTMNLANLNSRQALVMAEASALAQLDVANLSNRQQAAVQNAQNFLQVDMANLSNRQQTELFKAQQRTQALFTDQAATNAAAQFNASSQNQTDQFFANLQSTVSQFNATQQNAQSQFNAGQTNTIARFNEEINNARDQFDASNQLVIAQANATWRRQIATADTAAVNRANELNANAILDISKQAYSNLWNYYADTMEWAWTSAENQVDRNNALAIAELDANTRSAVAAEGSSGAAGNAIGSLIGTLGSAWILSGGLGGCWVAREIYGSKNVQWFIFRTWLQYDAPKWFKKLYMTHGENYAKLIAKVPPLKWATKKLMDMVVENKKEKHNVSCAH